MTFVVNKALKGRSIFFLGGGGGGEDRNKNGTSQSSDICSLPHTVLVSTTTRYFKFTLVY